MFESKIVFISGPMIGLDYCNTDAFIDAEYALRLAGFKPFNPIWWLIIAKDWDHKDIMAINMAALSRCNYIYQLEGWENSSDACAEWEYAKAAGIEVVNKSWLDWYVGVVEEYRKKREEERTEKAIQFINKNIMKGETKDEEKEELNEGTHEKAGQAGSEA